MGSAKVIIKQQDRSAIVPSLDGIEIGTVVNSKWGPIVPRLVTTPNQLIENYYFPDNSKGSSWNGAELLLANSNKVWVTRAIHDDAKYSASLVRFKKDGVDFNVFPAPDATPDVVVKGVVGGIALNALDSYSFPLYITNRVYADTLNTVFKFIPGSKRVEVTGLGFGVDTIVAGDVVSFGDTPNDASPIFTIGEARTEIVSEDVLTVNTGLTGTSGVEVKKWNGAAAISYSPAVFLIENAVTSTQLKVTDHDVIQNADLVTLDDGTTTSTVTSKDVVPRTAFVLDLTTVPTVSAGAKVQFMVSGTTEVRDAFLVVANYPGGLGDNIKVGIRPSVNYPDQAFFIDVYFFGALEESFEVTRTQFIDGFGNQIYMETVINGVSKYITVKDNLVDVDAQLPLYTTIGVWRRDPTDIFGVSALTTTEDVTVGDTLVTLSGVTGLVLNTRLKFGAAGEYEYKITNISGNVITLDRPLLETKVILGTALYLFNPALNDEPNGIYDGVQHYKFTSIIPLSNYSIGDNYTISDITGVVLDAGYNNAIDGSDGSNITLFDVIAAFNKMKNKEQYKISVFCDNGFAYPEVAIALDEICKGTNLSHGYLSTSYASELQNDYVGGIRAYRNSTNLNTEFCSIFSGWIQVTDVHNQTRVWVAPSVFGVNTQSFVTRNYYIFTPAAGWVYGRLNGLQVTRQFTEGERDALVDANINPVRYREGYGLAIWGNETLYVKPSPLQLRSVAMLLIVLKYGLENFLEFELFQMNNQAEWTKVETAISTFIRDTLFIPGGLYAYQVEVSKIITDTDIDNRRMPVFVGIQPTSDIKTIPVTIGIFNKSVSISV